MTRGNAVDDRRVAVVVEDDEDIRELMVALLGQSGFEVHAAANGTDGVDAVKENDPVLVTVDLGLPDIDGYEVTRRVRRFTDAYVVMLTARNEEIDTLMGLDAGADDYLTKPFRPRELRARVEAMLRRPRAAPAPAAETPGPTLATVTPAPAPGHAAGHAAEQGAGPTSGADGSAAATPSGSTGRADASSADARLALDGLVLYPHVHHVEAEGRDVTLTPTEFVLLETLLRSGRVVRSKAELTRILRGDEPDAGTFVSESDERTVEVHVGNMRRKLGDDPRRPRWIETVRGIGYRAAGAAETSG
ncbi:response regulator transcription factor [Citricoccus sp.]|uniref:response regulator transcription factor n=1 Tax=Citricoccus sp. TaxID=1978372 RepID=UPI002C1D1D9A|nr:response regulator transcription factor [Citricoccus sp.]HRO95229.1 response regulator transcription factor [Citricoccus sp.]